MVKFLKILQKAALVIAGLLFVLYGVFFYRDVQSYKNVLPKNATTVCKISVDAMALEMVWDAVCHPFAYVNEAADKANESLKKGVSIPANLLVFTVDSKKEDTFFTVLTVEDSTVFTKYLQQKWKLKKANSKFSYHLFENENTKLKVAFTDSKAIVSYANSGESVATVFQDLLGKESFVTNEELLQKVKSIQEDAVFITPTKTFLCNVKAGEIVIKTPENVVNKNIDQLENIHQNALFLEVHDFSWFRNSAIDFKDFSVNVDSLQTYTQGIFQVKVHGAVSQTDSVITYEYNDDFEKIPVVSTQTKEVPKLQCTIPAASKQLIAYLEQENLLLNNQIHKEVFPLYQLFVNQTPEVIQLSTEDHFESTEWLFQNSYCYLNFDELTNYKDLQFLREDMKSIASFEAYFKINHEEISQLEAHLKFKNTSQYPLKILLK